MHIKRIEPKEIEKVVEFYKACNYTGAISTDDLIIYAENDQKIIGIVRLCYENQNLVLRGMQVDSIFQRQGIGTALLKEIEKIIGARTCYCLPYAHLENFYSTIGFESIADKNAPPYLYKRLKSYRLQNRNVIVMKRQQNPSPPV